MHIALKYIHLLSLSLTLGIAFTIFFLSRCGGLSANSSQHLPEKVLALAKWGSYSLVALLLSGFGLWAWAGFSMYNGFFHAKLTLVLILIGFFGYLQVRQKKAKLATDQFWSILKPIYMVWICILALTLLAAVLTFN